MVDVHGGGDSVTAASVGNGDAGGGNRECWR